MADLVKGAMGNLVNKLGELLKEEYDLQTGVKERINELTLELVGAQTALRKVAQVPWDELDEQIKLWAREVRESSYDMEDILDIFLVRVQVRDSTKQESWLKRLNEKMTILFRKSHARREISVGVKDIMTHLDEVTKRCCRYKVNDIIVAKPATITSLVDPRLAAMYNKVKNLVGIDKPSVELIHMLQTQQRGDVMPNTNMKIVSIVGVGGLGKTTLAKAVYDKHKGDFDCGAFVPVGRNPDMKKVIKAILIELDNKRYMQFNFAQLDEIHQFINELRVFLLENKRYFIVVDDIWEVESWNNIKLAIDDDNNYGGRIIVTTRKLEVATTAGEVYKLQPLSCDSSRELLCTRMFGDQGSLVANQPDEISDKILKRCGGVPLAIITMASLLVDKPRDKWYEIYKTIGFGLKDSKEIENNTTRVLSFSYYDLPSHLRTCLLYLSAFPEDSIISKDSLVWKWVAEGFVHEQQGMRLFEIGEGYFNDLIKRSLIQMVESDDLDDKIIGCRVHDMVLDFIRSMSHEYNFFTILENDQRTALQTNVRRIAHHNIILGHTSQDNHFNGLPKVRSFIAQQCVIEKWVKFSGFALLRVLAIENCNSTDGRRICIEHLGHLLHLRYLSLRETLVRNIPKEIGALRFLQTLDLGGSNILETAWCSSLPTQLMCLHITFGDVPPDTETFSVERLTSLEELSIDVTHNCWSMRWLVKELGSLRELRVLNATIFSGHEDGIKRDLVEPLCLLHKLQHLEIRNYSLLSDICWDWEAAGLVLPIDLQDLAVRWVKFSKLPPCINSSCLPRLAHLECTLKDMDEQDLRILGRLPELRFLCLRLCCSAKISNIVGDTDATYFPKLRCCRLPWSMVLFVANEEDKSVSFHLWHGYGNDIAIPSDSDDDELLSSMPSVPDTDELQRPRKLQQQGLLAVAYYLLALLQHVLAFIVKKWTTLKQVGRHPLIPNHGSAQGNGEYTADIARVSAVSDDERKGSIFGKDAAAAPPFMPNLQVLHFQVNCQAVKDHHYCDNLGLECLSSLREISVDISKPWDARDDPEMEKVEAALRHAADEHPNLPKLRMKRTR